jgi:hypothetical protein
MKAQMIQKISFIVAISLLGFLQNNTAQQTSTNVETKIVFVDHLTAGLIEQDVFVEKEKGSGLVYRILPTERKDYLDAQLYKTVEPQKHDPFNARNAGPFKKGEKVGMTLGDWVSAKGQATYKCEDGWGKYEASFENLVPNATYTMWHFFMAKASTDPFTGTLDVPIGDRDGSHSVFTTDSNGKGVMSITFDQCLQLGDTQLAGGVAVAYHSDGKTYGVLPGDFGTVTHVQLFAMLPDVEAPVKVGDD